MMVIPPETSSNASAQSHTGEEVAFLHRGAAVEIELDGTRYTLHPGDSVRIPAGARHIWHNPGPEPAQIIFALSPPSF